MADRYSQYQERYEGDRDRYGRDRRERDDRGMTERAADEVRSWFGDDEAAHRRRMDEQEQARRRHEERPRSYGGISGSQWYWERDRMDLGRWRRGPFFGRGPRGYQRSDERIREDVNDRLTAHGFIDATDIECRVQNGEVTLSGYVDSREAKRAAEDVVEEVPGVRDVHNNLRVRSHAGDEGAGRTNVLGVTETQTQPSQPPDTGRSRTRTS